MWDLILAGRYIMNPIALCSLVGLAVFLERLWVLRRRRIVIPEIASAVDTLGAATDDSDPERTRRLEETRDFYHALGTELTSMIERLSAGTAGAVRRPVAKVAKAPAGGRRR